jgi:hypothetical protein
VVRQALERIGVLRAVLTASLGRGRQRRLQNGPRAAVEEERTNLARIRTKLAREQEEPR